MSPPFAGRGEIIQETDVLDRHWRDEGLSRPLHRAMTFGQAGLVLGRGTLLAKFEKERPRGLALDGNEARVVSLLTAAHGKPVARGAVEKIRRAGEFWCAGEKTLAQIHLAFLGLPQLDEMGAYRLFLAGVALEKGIEPDDLMRALGFPRAARDLEKYWEDQPRVPAGSGRESGEWTSGGRDGAGSTTFVERAGARVAGATMSDANPPGIVPGAQYAQLNPAPTISEETMNKIIRIHGPDASIKKGAFNAEYANAGKIRDLIKGAWEHATPMDVAASYEGRVILVGAVFDLDPETGEKIPYTIGRSA
ncbi:MAG TPA: hypothetical protein VHT02_00125, partial [Methylocella sp.]|nr:hypothetical protein [Methylocella sp.]